MSAASHACVRRTWLYAVIMILWILLHCGALAQHHDDHEHVKDIDDPTTHRRITNQQLQNQTKVANYIAVAGLTIYIWEYLCTLSHELYIWFHPRLLKRPQVLLFLAIRYVTVPAIVVPIYSMWGAVDEQSDCPKHEQITVAVVQFVVACIFSWRTIAIWRRRRWVIVSLVALTILLFLSSVSLLYFSQDAYLTTGECRPALVMTGDHDEDDIVRPVNTVQWFYLTCIVFDTIILLLSTYKLLVYANMGRAVNTIAFRDPFEAHRQQLEKNGAAEDQQPPMRSAPPLEVAERRHSGTSVVLRGLRSSMVSMVLFPYRKVTALYSWWFSLTPLVARLMRNGVLYFVVATAYSLNNFVLEAVKSLHSKSFLTLYAPLMCVMCQRMLLTEFKAVWSPYDEDSMIPGRELVDAVTGHNRRRMGQSDIDRFEFFASDLEERHASVVSPHSRHNSRLWSRKSAQPRAPDASPDAAVDPSSLEAGIQPYPPPECTDFSSNSGSPSEQAKETDADTTQRSMARPASPSPSVIPTVPPQAARHRLFQLTPAQQEQALRMAGL
ncbi:hypothetical protein MCAP1_003291 [Malassezia caprae]|uniref:DUF6533 domain-containing protein n=1 Tax=Malassezia caprae TaxID=1381934 RepID=A0AAF0IWU3_9BASI|nr:hypothetical protein MCAP1_003291 [Malassezia caprae]